MKKIYALLLIFSFHDLTAQTKLHVFKITPSVKADVEKVANDYYSHFDYLKGEQIDETAQSIEYRCKLLPQGALESTITEFKNQQNVYSWQAVMLNTEDFNKAEKKYKELYKQLDGSSFMLHGSKKYNLEGVYDIPTEERAFASSILSLDVNQKGLQLLKIEVSLSYLLPDWSVKLLIYEKQSDEDIRPSE